MEELEVNGTETDMEPTKVNTENENGQNEELSSVVRKFRVENKSNYIKENKNKPLKYREMEVNGLGLPPVYYTDSGLPRADIPSINKLLEAPNPHKPGIALQYFMYLYICIYIYIYI